MPTFIVLLIITQLLQTAVTEGIFEMRIEQFQLDEHFPAWKCCTGDEGPADRSFTSCLAKCQFLIRVCLEEHQVVWKAHRTPDCPLGGISVPLPLTQLNTTLANISFHVARKWQENFTLILDVLHDLGPTSTPKLLFRLPSNELNFTSHHHWKVKSFGSRAASNDEKTSTPASAQRGIGLTVLSTFKFICAPGYFGPLCAGQCDSGGNLLAAPECGSPQAQCRNGYRGEHCDMPICSQGCINGDCVEPETCRCNQGWAGAVCGLCRVYPGCKHGFCLVDADTQKQLPFTCACEDGWGGMLCDIDLNFCQNNKGVCKNHGKCENVQSSNNQAYKCVCPPGFRGDHCEMIQRDCLIHGCQNSGECTQHLDGQNRCMCPKGYYGNLCEFNQTECFENPCQAENSVCHPLPRAQKGRQFLCACPPGFTGDNCEIDIDDCAAKPCQNGAFCEDLISSYRCVCPPGYTGVWCEKRDLECPPNTCTDGSECVKTKEGTFKCSRLNRSMDPPDASNVIATSTSAEKGNIVMVHLQPSFLGLTIGIPVAIVLSGLVVAIAVCFIMAVCVYRREKQKKVMPLQIPNRPPDDDINNGYGSETSTIWSTYEPLNTVRSNESFLPKLSIYPSSKVDGKLNQPAEPSVYHQQRYAEAPLRGPYTLHFASTPLSHAAMGGDCEPCEATPALPPRPNTRQLVTYPAHFLRPLLYPVVPKTIISNKYAYASMSPHNRRHKEAIVYALLTPPIATKGVSIKPASPTPPASPNRYQVHTAPRRSSDTTATIGLPKITYIEAKFVGDVRTNTCKEATEI